MDGKIILSIQCPKCKKKNSIETSRPVTCQNCEEPLTNQKTKKTMGVVITALVIGLSGGYALDDLLEKNRYPVDVEYGIIETCLSASEQRISRSNYVRKQEICECALVRSQEEVNFYKYLNSQDEFLNVFQVKLDQCM